jgi:photosystem II stability/assembly factor-like uncharacterized protein
VISDIYFVNDFIGYAAGMGNSIYKTEDGGESWEGLNTGLFSYETSNLAGGSLYFIDNQTGWYVGQQNTILKTGNGGSSWTKLNSGISLLPNQYVHYKNLFFNDSNNGWVVGYIGSTSGGDLQGVVLKTTNGGLSWSSQIFGTGLFSISFTSSQKGWIVGGQGSIYVTADGGNNWITQSSGTLNLLHDVAFKNDEMGIIVGMGTVLITTNGGLNWTAKSVSSSTLYSVNYLESGISFAVGGGKLYKSNDNGNNWSIQNDSLPWGTDRIFFTSTLKGWYSSSQGEGLGIGKTIDGGESWSKKTASGELSKLFLLKNPLKIWGIKWKGLLHSPDGHKWRYIESDLISNMKDIFFKDENNGWIVGGYNFNNNMIRTTDGGNTWAIQNNNANQNFNSIFFIDTSFGWAAGTNGTIIQTLDGGQTWGLQSTPTTAHLHGISFANREVGYAGGKGTYGAHWGKNVILKTFNSGLLWNVIYIDSSGGEISKVYCSDENTIFVSISDKIYKSVDGGTSWNIIFNNSYVVDFNFPGSSNGWVSTGSYIYKTLDGGSTWGQNSFSQSGAPFNSLVFLNTMRGWTSFGSSILYTDNGGITDIDELPNVSLNPKDFTLFQNYPNPFNPSTTIKFDIPSYLSYSNVSLKVYDILGNEIAVLVDGVKPSGSYTVEWDASKFSTGVYFYKLQLSSFLSVKKMVLIK